MGPIDVSASAGVSRSVSTVPSVSSDSTRRLRSLSGLSNRELLSRVKDLVARERAVTLEILLHLLEVERRRLHVGLGFASMFDYCTRHLGYSESAAARRIRAARCIRDYPEARGLLERNEANLVAISLVSSILSKANAMELLGKIRGKSQREVEAIVATYRPAVSLRDCAKPVCVAVPGAGGAQLNGPRGDLTATADSEKRPNTPASGDAAGPLQAPPVTQAQSHGPTHPSAVQPSLPAVAAGQTSGASRLERKFQMQFLASERFMKKFEKARALLSNANGTLSYEFVLEAALDEFLKDHDPEEREKRRKNRREKAEAKTKSEDRPTKNAQGSREKGGNGSAVSGQADGYMPRSERAGSGSVDGPLFRRRAGGLPTTRVVRDRGLPRRIPAAVRDAVFARDKGRCTYVGSNGGRCASRRHLQIDHVIPYARGGTNAPGNLRLLCERHNKKEAERVLGTDAMRRFRARE